MNNIYIKYELHLPRKSNDFNAALLKYLPARLTRDTGWLYKIAVFNLILISLNLCSNFTRLVGWPSG